MKKLKEKLYKNALVGERLLKLDKKERQKVVTELLAVYSERELSEKTGIPYSTLHDWKTGRQKNKGKDIHISFNTFYRKLKELNPSDIDKIKDWGRLEQIKAEIERLLRLKK